MADGLDRNAKTAGMQKDLHLSSNDYDWLLTIFYISYSLFEFQALMWKILPPHVWASIVVFVWYALRIPIRTKQVLHTL